MFIQVTIPAQRKIFAIKFSPSCAVCNITKREFPLFFYINLFPTVCARSNTTTQDYTIISLFSDEENYAASTTMLCQSFGDAGGSVYVGLEKGMVLTINTGNCLVQLANTNWAP